MSSEHNPDLPPQSDIANFEAFPTRLSQPVWVICIYCLVAIANGAFIAVAYFFLRNHFPGAWLEGPDHLGAWW